MLPLFCSPAQARDSTIVKKLNSCFWREEGILKNSIAAKTTVVCTKEVLQSRQQMKVATGGLKNTLLAEMYKVYTATRCIPSSAAHLLYIYQSFPDKSPRSLFGYSALEGAPAPSKYLGQLHPVLLLRHICQKCCSVASVLLAAQGFALNSTANLLQHTGKSRHLTPFRLAKG